MAEPAKNPYGPLVQVGGKVVLTDRSGKLVQVDPKDATEVLDAGQYLPATAAQVAKRDQEKKYGGAGSTIAAAGEGVVRGAVDAATIIPQLAGKGVEAVTGEDPTKGVFGGEAFTGNLAYLLGEAQGKGGEAAAQEYENEARARAEENPLASGLGYLGGQVLGSGGVTALGRGAAAQAPKAIGAIGRLGVAGATEGALLGAAQVNEEAFIGDSEATGEKMLAAMGWGALIGGGVGIAAGGAGRLFKRSGSRGATPLDSPYETSGSPYRAAAPERSLADDVSELGLENASFRRADMMPERAGPARAGYADIAPDQVNAVARGEVPSAAGKEFPPVDVTVFPDGKIALQDGRHRLAAARDAGATEIRAHIRRMDDAGNIVDEIVAPVSIAPREAATDIGGAFGPPSGIRGKLQGYAEERTAKALGFRFSDLKKLGKDAAKAEREMRSISREVLEHKLDDGTQVMRAVQSQDELASNVVRARDEIGSKIGKIRDEADEFIKTKKPELGPRVEHIVEQVQRELIEPLASNPHSEIAAKAVALQSKLDDLAKLGPEPTLKELTQFRVDLDKLTYPQPTGPGLPPMPSPMAQEFQALRGIIEQHVEAATDKAVRQFDPSRVGSYEKLKVKYAAFKRASQIAGQNELRELGNRVVSPSDYITGAAVFAGDLATGGGFGAALKAAAVTGAHKAVRENASRVLAVMANRLAQNVDAKVGRSLGGFLQRSAIKPALETGEARALPAATRHRVPTAIPASLALFQGRSKSAQDAYVKRVQEIEYATQDFGSGVRERSQQALGDLAVRAPKLQQSIVVSATKGAEFLKSKIPTTGRNPSPLAPSRTTQPSELELRKFARYWSAVSNPLSVLDDLQDGMVTHEQVEALQAVYPKLYEQIRNTTFEKIRELDMSGKRIPYQSRLQLNLLLDLGGAGEPTMTADFMVRFSQMQQQSAQGGAGNPAAPSPRPQRPVNIAEQFGAGSDKLLGGSI